MIMSDWFFSLGSFVMVYVGVKWYYRSRELFEILKWETKEEMN